MSKQKKTETVRTNSKAVFAALETAETQLAKALENVRVAKSLFADPNAKVIKVKLSSVVNHIANDIKREVKKANPTIPVLVNEPCPCPICEAERKAKAKKQNAHAPKQSKPIVLKPAVKKDAPKKQNAPAPKADPSIQYVFRLPKADRMTVLKNYEDVEVREDNTIALSTFNKMFGFGGNGLDFTQKHIRLGNLKKDGNGINYKEAKRFIGWFFDNAEKVNGMK